MKRQFKFGALASMLAFGGLGLSLLVASQAAIPTTGLEAENGQRSAATRLITDTTASTDRAVKFGAASTADAIIISPTGSDTTGTGSLAAPYKSFTKAQAVVVPGKTIYARGGTYAGTITLTKSGATDRPITYASYPGETARIAGSSNEYYGQAVLYLKQLHDIVIQNMELRGGSGQGLKVEAGRNIVIADNIIHDIVLGGLVVSGDNVRMSGNEVYDSVLANNDGQFGSGGWPAAFATELTPSRTAATNITMMDNYVHDNWGEGMGLFHADGAVMDNNRAVSNYSMNIYSDESKNLRITNNSVSATNGTHNRHDNGHRPTGIGIASERGQVAPTNMIIDGNTVGGGLFAAIVKFTHGYGPVTQSPNPQNF